MSRKAFKHFIETVLIGRILEKNERSSTVEKTIHAIEITPESLEISIDNKRVKDYAILAKKYIAVLSSITPKLSSDSEIHKYSYIQIDASGYRAVLFSPSYKALGDKLTKASKHRSIRKTVLGLDKNNKRRFDIGHIQVADVSEANTVFGHKIGIASSRMKEKNLFKDTPILATEKSAIDMVLQNALKELETIHAKFTVDINKESYYNAIKHNNAKLLELDLFLTMPHSTKVNRTILAKKERQIYEGLKKELKLIANLPSSPSVIEKLKLGLGSTFTGKKRSINSKSDKSHETNKVDIKSGIKIKAHKTKRGGSAIYGSAIDRNDGISTNTVQLLSLLNQQISEYVEYNMGRGSSNTKLNYRTGRFADSVEISSVLTSRQGDLLVDYKYQEDPYKVFAPGGNLYKPGRSPVHIINTSIRQLASRLVGNKFKVSPRHVGDSGWTPPRR